MPRCLWVTFADPEPRHSGQFVYSGGLIDAVARTGTEVEVLALGGVASDKRNGNRGAHAHVVWWLAEQYQPAHWRSLLSRLPYIAFRCCTPGMRRYLDHLLSEKEWDGIVFDGLSSAWALPTCSGATRARRRAPG
jgi:hypothetical protein